MKKIINILAFTPSPGDATSFYRALGPLLELQRSGIVENLPDMAKAFKQDDFYVMKHNINIIQAEAHRFSWQLLAQADIVFMQRPHQPVMREVARLAKRMGRPLWVDLDDDHLDVPTHSKVYNIYTDLDNMQAHKDILNVADIVTFSTQYLLEKYVERGIVHNVELINNALPEWVNHIVPTTKKEEGLHIVWRGSESHSRELAMYLPQLNHLIKTFPEARFTFFGYIPALEKADNVKYIPHTRANDITEYFQTLANLHPDLVIVPLEFNSFNKCKSNIAMLEAHWAGASCIGPSTHEWRQCISKYTPDNSFYEAVFNFIKRSVVDLKPIKWLTETNKIREQIILKLYNREYQVNNKL